MNPPSVIFDLPPAKKQSERLSVNSATGAPRKVHIRRLWDLLHLCLLRGQADQACRIWAILMRCREVDLVVLWDLGLRLISAPNPTPLADSSSIEYRLSYLKACRNLSDHETAKVLIEYICLLVSVGRRKDAFDELQLWLSALPCSQDAELHEYAGLITLSIIPSPPPSEDPDELDNSPQNIQEYLASLKDHVMFGRAKTYFERALSLDPACVVSKAYLEIMDSFSICREEEEADLDL